MQRGARRFFRGVLLLLGAALAALEAAALLRNTFSTSAPDEAARLTWPPRPSFTFSTGAPERRQGLSLVHFSAPT
jgi:hypothetical protein